MKQMSSCYQLCQSSYKQSCFTPYLMDGWNSSFVCNLSNALQNWNLAVKYPGVLIQAQSNPKVGEGAKRLSVLMKGQSEPQPGGCW